jgi:hypothetical protein
MSQHDALCDDFGKTRNDRGGAVCLKDDIANVKEFRSRLIEFLRLPLDIRESQLREALQECSPAVLANYTRRVEWVQRRASRSQRRAPVVEDPEYDEISPDQREPGKRGPQPVQDPDVDRVEDDETPGRQKIKTFAEARVTDGA